MKIKHLVYLSILNECIAKSDIACAANCDAFVQLGRAKRNGIVWMESGKMSLAAYITIQPSFNIGLMRFDLRYCGGDLLRAIDDGTLNLALSDENENALSTIVRRYNNPMKNIKETVHQVFVKVYNQRS